MATFRDLLSVVLETARVLLYAYIAAIIGVLMFSYGPVEIVAFMLVMLGTTVLFFFLLALGGMFDKYVKEDDQESSEGA